MELLGLSVEQIREVIAPLGMPAFRAKQISLWMASGVTDFADMTNLSNKDRELLAQHHIVIGGSIESHRISQKDGTEKFLFRFEDGAFAEGVLMQYEHGNSVCISSQSGCKMGCAFCASSKVSFTRNLTAGEMAYEVIAMEAASGKKVGHIVLMGVGEPLDNYDNVLAFIRYINSSEGKNIGMRNISLSTCGIVPRIYDLTKEHMGITLSVSLHAPDDETRSKIMPINRRYSIKELMEACDYYFRETGRRISYEYALIRGVNDSDESCDKLIRLLRGRNCHVNLIGLNYVKESPLLPSDRMRNFCDRLNRAGINATVRRKLGEDIDGACGQLRAEKNREEVKSKR